MVIYWEESRPWQKVYSNALAYFLVSSKEVTKLGSVRVGGGWIQKNYFKI